MSRQTYCADPKCGIDPQHVQGSPGCAFELMTDDQLIQDAADIIFNDGNQSLGEATDTAQRALAPALERVKSLTDALVRNQWMLENINRSQSTNFREVADRIIANRAALNEVKPKPLNDRMQK